MSISQNDAQALDAALVAAPFTEDGWQQALTLLARLTNCTGGQLIGMSQSQGLLFHIESGFSSEDMQMLERMGGYTGELNPRISAVLAAKPRQILSEPDFINVEERNRSALYQEVLVPAAADQSCIARIGPTGDVLVGLCVLRSGNQGDYTQEERTALAAVIPHMDAAMRLHLAMEQRGAQMASRAFDTFGSPAFLFARNGKVTALSRAAEDLVRQRNFLRLNHGTLCAIDAASDIYLQLAITQTCACNAPLSAPVPIILRSPDSILIAEMARIPQDYTNFGGGAVAVLLAPRAALPSHTRGIIAVAFGLTSAEADIAFMICEGRNVRRPSLDAAVPPRKRCAVK